MQDEYEIVYVIRDEHNRIKIGKSTFTNNQFNHRLSVMQTGNADNLIVEAIFQSEELSSIDLEHSLHNVLQSKYIRGEWYNCNMWDIFDALSTISYNSSVAIDCYRHGNNKKYGEFNDFGFSLYLTAKDGELRWVK